MNVSGAVSIGDIFASLTLEDSFSGRLQVAAAQLENIGKVWNKVGAQLGSVANAMLPLSLAVAGAGTAAVVAAGQFESTLTKISTLAGVTADDLAKVKDHLLDLAPAVGVGPQALADAMFVVSSTVEDTATALQILDTAARASAAGLGDAKEVARALTSIINSYGAANISAARAGDILAATVKAGGAEANEMAGTLGRVIPIAAQAGVKFEEVGAFMATFTKLGVDASEAVTALRGVMTTLLSPTKDAEKALLDVGSSTDALRRSVRERGLTDTMVGLIESFRGNETAAAAVFGNVRALAGVMGTAGAQAATYRSVLEQVTQSTGLLDKAFDRIKKTQVQTWNELTATIGVLAVKVGDALAPAFMSALQAMQPLITAAVQMATAFASLPQPVQTLAIAFGVAVAAAAPLLFMFSSFAKVIGSLSTAIGTLVGWWTADTAALVSDTAATAANTTAKVANAAAARAASAAAAMSAEANLAASFAAQEAAIAARRSMTGLAVIGTETATSVGAVSTAFLSWPVVIGAAVTALVLGVDGLKSLGSMASSTGSILVSFAKQSVSAASGAFVIAGDAAVQFGGMLLKAQTGVSSFGEVVGGLRGKLHDVADGFREFADQASKGNWLGIANAIKPAAPMLAAVMEALTGVGAAAANARGQVFQYQTAEDAAAAAAGHHGWVLEQNAKHIKTIHDAFDAYGKTLVALSQAEKEAMDKLNNREVTDTATLYAGALTKVDTVGKMTRESQVKLAESMEEAIKIYQAAGKAVPAEMVRIGEEARRMSGSVSASTQAILDMAAAGDKLRMQQNGTKLQNALFDVDQWEKDQIKMAKDAGTFSSAWLDTMKKTSKSMRDNALIDFDAIKGGIGGVRKEALDAVTVAQNTLNRLVESGASALDVNAARDRLDKARDYAASFQQFSNAALDSVKDKAQQTHDAVERIMQPVTVMLDDLSEAQFKALGGMQALKAIEDSYKTNPGRREGGSGTTGVNPGDWKGYMAMLEERVRYAQLKAAAGRYGSAQAAPPAQSAWHEMTGGAPPVGTHATAGIAARGGVSVVGMQNTFYVNGTAEESAAKIGEILMRKARNSRQFPSLG